ncbi:hypothetical protein [Pseudodesulfovibrio hydrargyri]|uniref:hypothetical protein n=1 Tax=Pseudodesulfovibrio hydrargyri TaxID=2125990 RepID=UPI00101AD56B|nr:hypothetical protein [Pseudodesulfovibrio hydrargyri]
MEWRIFCRGGAKLNNSPTYLFVFAGLFVLAEGKTGTLRAHAAKGVVGFMPSRFKGAGSSGLFSQWLRSARRADMPESQMTKSDAVEKKWIDNPCKSD